MMLCPVWYDEYSLNPGDSLRESIDRGLSTCPKCIVILSSAFLSNPGWAKGEFNAIISRHFAEGGSILVPIWHGVDRDEVAAYSPLVADVVALNSNVGLEELVRQIFRAVGG
jgi:TIR domain